MFLLLTLAFFFLLPRPAAAQIPLLHYLFTSYRPANLNLTPQPSSAAPTPKPPENSSTPAVLGASVTLPPDASSLPPIGGQGQIISLALLGDSMIQTIPQDTLQKSLAQYFPAVKFDIHNLSQPAATISQAQNQLPQIFNLQPDILVIESFAYNNFGNSQQGIDQQWLTLGAITSQVKTKLPSTKIVLAAAIAPNSVVFANGSQYHFSALEKIEKTKTIKLYLQNLVNFATSQNFTLADAYTPSLSPQNEGLLPLISSTDYLHPSELGHQFFCDTLASTIFHHQLIQ